MSRKPRSPLFTRLALLAVLCISGCELPLGAKEDPELVVDPTSLHLGESLPFKTFSITNGGDGTLDWSVSVDAATPWCAVHPDAGVDSESITVTVDRAHLSPGSHTARITVDSNAGWQEVLVHVEAMPTGDILIDVPLPAD